MAAHHITNLHLGLRFPPNFLHQIHKVFFLGIAGNESHTFIEKFMTGPLTLSTRFNHHSIPILFSQVPDDATAFAFRHFSDAARIDNDDISSFTGTGQFIATFGKIVANDVALILVDFTAQSYNRDLLNFQTYPSSLPTRT